MACILDPPTNVTHTSVKVAWGHYQSVEDCLYLGDQVANGILLLLTWRQISVPLEQGAMEGLLKATLRRPDRGKGWLRQYDVEGDVRDEGGPALQGTSAPAS